MFAHPVNSVSASTNLKSLTLKSEGAGSLILPDMAYVPWPGTGAKRKGCAMISLSFESSLPRTENLRSMPRWAVRFAIEPVRRTSAESKEPARRSTFLTAISREKPTSLTASLTGRTRPRPLANSSLASSGRRMLGRSSFGNEKFASNCGFSPLKSKLRDPVTLFLPAVIFRSGILRFLWTGMRTSPAALKAPRSGGGCPITCSKLARSLPLV